MSDAREAGSRVESVSTSLRRQIINGEIPPGLRLTESWASARFSVARPTARGGLDRLIAEGLLRRGPHRSAMVPAFSPTDILDIYLSREPIELLAVITLANRSEAPSTAENAVQLMRAATERDEHVEHTEADAEFHRALVLATGSERLRRMHETVMGEAELCIAQVRQNALVDLRELTDRHAAILDAIKDGDSEAAARALKADLDGCRDLLVDHSQSAGARDRLLSRVPYAASKESS